MVARRHEHHGERVCRRRRLINPRGERAQGRAEIAALFQREHAGPWRQTILTPSCEAPRFLSATVASLTCPYTLKPAPGAASNVYQSGTYTLVMVKHAGRWVVADARPMFPPPLAPTGNMPAR